MELETIEHAGLTIKIHHDEDCESFLQDDIIYILTPHARGAGNFRIDSRRDHALQHHHDELFDRGMGKMFGRFVSIFHPEYVAMPVYMYQHGDVALSAKSFIGRAQHAEWDSGMIGWGIMPRTYEMGGEVHDFPNPERVIRNVVEEHGRWMNGETYGYTVEDESGVELDACWGYIGWEFVELQAKHAAEDLARELIEAL